MYKIVVKENSDLTPFFYQKALVDLAKSDGSPSNIRDFKSLASNLFEERKLTVRKRNRIFKNLWEDMHNIDPNKVPDPQDFRVIMLDSLPLNHKKDFAKWFKGFFKKDKIQKLRTKEADGTTKDYFLQPEDIESRVVSSLEELREGLDDISHEKQSDERELGINDLLYLKELGINISMQEFNKVKEAAWEIPKFEDWLKHASSKYFALVYSKLPNWKRNGLHKMYNRMNSIIVTNTPGGLENIRDNYIIRIKEKWNEDAGMYEIIGYDVELKGPQDKDTGNQNSIYEKITLFEANNQMNLFHFISTKDIKQSRALTNEDGEFVRDRLGDIVKRWSQRYNNLNSRELLLLSKDLIS